MRLPKPLTLFSVALLCCLPASAHHSFAMFDPDNVVTLRGTVTQFRWVNPHVAIFVQTSKSGARSGLWAVELTSPANLRRRGWSRTTLKAGDKVVVQINPLRDGRHAGGFRTVQLVDTGKVIGAPLIEIERGD